MARCGHSGLCLLGMEGMFCTIEVCDGYGKADCRTYYYIFCSKDRDLIKIGQG